MSLSRPETSGTVSVASREIQLRIAANSPLSQGSNHTSGVTIPSVQLTRLVPTRRNARNEFIVHFTHALVIIFANTAF
jgi:hypothetical protein